MGSLAPAFEALARPSDAPWHLAPAVTHFGALIGRWQREYNQVRPHGALEYRPPAPRAILPLPPGSAPPGGNGVRTNLRRWYNDWGQVSGY